MHWNVAPDALPGSATFVRVLDRWFNDCTNPSSRAQPDNVGVGSIKMVYPGQP